jgi:hypothetical protein
MIAPDGIVYRDDDCMFVRFKQGESCLAGHVFTLANMNQEAMKSRITSGMHREDVEYEKYFEIVVDVERCERITTYGMLPFKFICVLAEMAHDAKSVLGCEVVFKHILSNHMIYNQVRDAMYRDVPRPGFLTTVTYVQTGSGSMMVPVHLDLSCLGCFSGNYLIKGGRVVSHAYFNLPTIARDIIIGPSDSISHLETIIVDGSNRIYHSDRYSSAFLGCVEMLSSTMFFITAMNTAGTSIKKTGCGLISVPLSFGLDEDLYVRLVGNEKRVIDDAIQSVVDALCRLPTSYGKKLFFVKGKRTKLHKNYIFRPAYLLTASACEMILKILDDQSERFGDCCYRRRSIHQLLQDAYDITLEFDTFAATGRINL